MITVVDYGMGNVGSVLNMLKRIKVPARLSADPADIATAHKIILPGVGHFDRAMERLHANPALLEALERKVLQDKTPILGICLGMQILLNGSEEGDRPGLGWIPGEVKRFRLDGDARLKVPNMGWCPVSRAAQSPLTEWNDEAARFYFVHSYYSRAANDNDCILKAWHGVDFDAGLRRDNVYGVQFHPEKSHRFGMKLLDNFARSCP